ncbi:hypothetical protein QL285_017147 [Trifolium repens]|nr:hypothetical protein QL285_017147 [Trifolium repens]
MWSYVTRKINLCSCAPECLVCTNKQKISHPQQTIVYNSIVGYCLENNVVAGSWCALVRAQQAASSRCRACPGEGFGRAPAGARRRPTVASGAGARCGVTW